MIEDRCVCNYESDDPCQFCQSKQEFDKEHQRVSDNIERGEKEMAEWSKNRKLIKR